MQAAIGQREAITPELLRVLEAVADDPAKWAKRDNYMLHLFALFLLRPPSYLRAMSRWCHCGGRLGVTTDPMIFRRFLPTRLALSTSLRRG
jgi:hypothetical protein